MCAYAWGALPLALVIYGAALFLNRSLGVSQAVIGKVLWIPPLGWEIGYFAWGWAADRQMAAGRPPRSAFATPARRRRRSSACRSRWSPAIHTSLRPSWR